MAVQALNGSLNSLIPSLEDGIKGTGSVSKRPSQQSTSRVERLKDREPTAPTGLSSSGSPIVRQTNVTAEPVESQPEDNAGIGRSLDVFA